LSEEIFEILPSHVVGKVGDVDLTSTTTGSSSVATPCEVSSPHASFEAAAAGAWGSESGFCFAIFADVNESAHEVLVAERVDRLLGLLPRRVLYNSASLRHSIREKQYICKQDLAGLSHEILEVVPLDIVGKVADVDAAVLLRGLPKRLHHLLLGLDSFLRVPRRRSSRRAVRSCV